MNYLSKKFNKQSKKVTIYSIYCITNIVNNKKYIGYTSKNPINRWKEHIKASNRNIRNNILYKAIRKHGIENFSFEVIYQSKDGYYTLRTMEEYFIREYKSFKTEWGYNMTYGGEGSFGYECSDEVKEKFRILYKGKKLTPERIKLITEKTPKGENTTGAKYSRKRFKISYDTGETEVIKGLRKFCLENNYDRANINRLINKKRKSCKNIIQIERID